VADILSGTSGKAPQNAEPGAQDVRATQQNAEPGAQNVRATQQECGPGHRECARLQGRWRHWSPSETKGVLMAKAKRRHPITWNAAVAKLVFL